MPVVFSEANIFPTSGSMLLALGSEAKALTVAAIRAAAGYLLVIVAKGLEANPSKPRAGWSGTRSGFLRVRSTLSSYWVRRGPEIRQSGSTKASPEAVCPALGAEIWGHLVPVVKNGRPVGRRRPASLLVSEGYIAPLSDDSELQPNVIVSGRCKTRFVARALRCCNRGVAGLLLVSCPLAFWTTIVVSQPGRGASAFGLKRLGTSGM